MVGASLQALTVDECRFSTRIRLQGRSDRVGGQQMASVATVVTIDADLPGGPVPRRDCGRRFPGGHSLDFFGWMVNK